MHYHQKLHVCSSENASAGKQQKLIQGPNIYIYIYIYVHFIEKIILSAIQFYIK